MNLANLQMWHAKNPITPDLISACIYTYFISHHRSPSGFSLPNHLLESVSPDCDPLDVAEIVSPKVMILTTVGKVIE